MPQTVRVTSFFSGKSQGWSESYVYPISDNQTPQGAYVAIFDNIANARAQCLGREYTLDFVRVAIIYDSTGQPVKRAVVIKNPGYTPSLQTATNSAEQPNACALVTWTSTDGKRTKKTFLGGPPDEIFNDAGVYRGDKAGNWASRFSAWREAQLAAAVGWLTDVPGLPPQNVSTITSNPNLTKTITVADPIFDPSEIGLHRTVRIKGVNGRSVYNGAWVVVVNAEDAFTTVDAFAAAPYSSGGVVTAYTFPKPVAQAAGCLVDREGTHKRGRPMVATRGRLAARPKL